MAHPNLNLITKPEDSILAAYNCIEFIYTSAEFIGEEGVNASVDVEFSGAMTQGKFIRLGGIEFVASITANDNGRLIQIGISASNQLDKFIATLNTNYVISRDYDITQVNTTTVRITAKKRKDKNFDLQQSTNDPNVAFNNDTEGTSIKESANYRAVGIIEIWDGDDQEWTKQDEDVRTGRLVTNNNQPLYGEFKFAIDRFLRKYSKPGKPVLSDPNMQEVQNAVVPFRHTIVDGGGRTFQLNYYSTGDFYHYLNGAYRRENIAAKLKSYYDFSYVQRIKFLNQMPGEIKLDCCSQMFLSVLIEAKNKQWTLHKWLRLYYDDGSEETINVESLDGEGTSVVDIPSGPKDLAICDQSGNALLFSTNLVDNGDFRDLSEWTYTNAQPYAWSIVPGNPGYAEIDYDPNNPPTAFQLLINDIDLQAGQTYEYSFEVTNYQSGRLLFGHSNNIQFYYHETIKDNGTYTGTFTVNQANGGWIAFLNLPIIAAKMRIGNVVILKQGDNLVSRTVKCYSIYGEIEVYKGGTQIPGEEDPYDGCNLIRDADNGTFESGFNGIVNNGMSNMGLDAANVRSGSNALYAAVPSSGNPTIPWFGFWHGSTVNLNPNTTYRIGIWVYLPSAQAGLSKISIGIKSGWTDATVIQMSEWENGTDPYNQWFQVWGLMTTGNDPDGRIGVVFDTPSGSGPNEDAWYDDFEICLFDQTGNLMIDGGFGEMDSLDGLEFYNEATANANNSTVTISFVASTPMPTTEFAVMWHENSIAFQSGEIYVVTLQGYVEDEFIDRLYLKISTGFANTNVIYSNSWDKGEDDPDLFTWVMVIEATGTSSGTFGLYAIDQDGYNGGMNIEMYQWSIEKVVVGNNIFYDGDGGTFEDNINGMATETNGGLIRRSGGLAFRGDHYMELLIPDNQVEHGQLMAYGTSTVPAIQEGVTYIARARIQVNISELDCLCDLGVPPSRRIRFRLIALNGANGITEEYINEWDTENCDPVASWFELETLITGNNTTTIELGVQVISEGDNEFVDGDEGTMDDITGMNKTSIVDEFQSVNNEGNGSSSALNFTIINPITPSTWVELISHDTPVSLTTGNKYIVRVDIKMDSTTNGPEKFRISRKNGFNDATVEQVVQLDTTQYTAGTYVTLAILIDVATSTSGRFMIECFDSTGIINSDDVFIDNWIVREVSKGANILTAGDSGTFDTGITGVNAGYPGIAITHQTGAAARTGAGYLQAEVMGAADQLPDQEPIIWIPGTAVDAGGGWFKATGWIYLDFAEKLTCPCATSDVKFKILITAGGNTIYQQDLQVWSTEDCDPYETWHQLESNFYVPPGVNNVRYDIIFEGTDADTADCFTGENILFDDIEIVQYSEDYTSIGNCLENSILLFDEFELFKLESNDGVQDEDAGFFTEEQKVCLHDCCEREVFIYRNELGRFDTILTRKIDQIGDSIEGESYSEMITCESTIDEGGITDANMTAEESMSVYTDYMTYDKVDQLRVFLNSVERYHIVDGEYRRIVIPNGDYPLWKKSGSKFRSRFNFTYNYSYPTLRK